MSTGTFRVYITLFALRFVLSFYVRCFECIYVVGRLCELACFSCCTKARMEFVYKQESFTCFLSRVQVELCAEADVEYLGLRDV